MMLIWNKSIQGKPLFHQQIDISSFFSLPLEKQINMLEHKRHQSYVHGQWFPKGKRCDIGEERNLEDVANHNDDVRHNKCLTQWELKF